MDRWPSSAFTGLVRPLFWKGGPKPGCKTVDSGALSVTSSDIPFPLPMPTFPERDWDFFGLCRDSRWNFLGAVVFSGVFSFLLIRQGLAAEFHILIMPRGSLSLPLDFSACGKSIKERVIKLKTGVDLDGIIL